MPADKINVSGDSRIQYKSATVNGKRYGAQPETHHGLDTDIVQAICTASHNQASTERPSSSYVAPFQAKSQPSDMHSCTDSQTCRWDGAIRFLRWWTWAYGLLRPIAWDTAGRRPQTTPHLIRTSNAQTMSKNSPTSWALPRSSSADMTGTLRLSFTTTL